MSDPVSLQMSSGLRHLRRLETFLDVVYGLLFWQMISYLPRVEDMAWVGEPFGVLSVFVGHREQVVRIIVGVGLTFLNWASSNRRLGGMSETDGRHAAYSVLQLISVCLFVYFAIADPRLEGGPSSPAMQCVCVILAGVFASLGWRYAIREGMLLTTVTAEEQAATTRAGLIEPMVALLNLPLAWVGPGFWTIGWFVFPIPVAWLLDRREARKGSASS